MKVKVKLKNRKLFGLFGKTITVDIDDSWNDSSDYVVAKVVNQVLLGLYKNIQWEIKC
jgi:hypothetical protein